MKFKILKIWINNLADIVEIVMSVDNFSAALAFHFKRSFETFLR